MTIKNAAPRFLFDGVDDNSRGTIPDVPLRIPTHLPLLLPRCSWGPEDDQLVSGRLIKEVYGDDIFDRRSKYFTHQNMFVETINEEANMVLLRRIVADNAPAPAGLTLCAEVVADDVANYQRNTDGSYKVDADGNRLLDTLAPSIAGHRVRVFTRALAAGGVGTATQGAGTMVSERDSVAGVVYPILDLQRPHRGARGNRGGVRLTAPTVNSTRGTRDDLIEDQRAFIYRLQMLERPDDRSSPLIKTTVSGDQSIDFTFKIGVYDKYSKVDYGIDEKLLQSYNAKSANGMPPTWGVFSKYHLYEENLEEVLRALHSTEIDFGTAGETEDDFHMVNFLTGVSYLGYPYYSIVVEGPAGGGQLFTDATVHYAQGGGDGDLTNEAYEAGVSAFLDGFMEDSARMWDPWRCPFSVLYDSGFSLPTKLKFPKMLGYRDDVYVVFSTQDFNRPLNTEAEDYSIGVALANEVMSYPESVLHGTGAMRAIIIGHAGVMPAAKVKDAPVPLTYKFATDCAGYMGAGDGIWIRAARPDSPANNVVKGYTEINARSKTDKVVDDFWNAGIVWAQYKDRADQFIPLYQSVYDDDTSVLNSAFNMIIAVDVIKVCRQVWTELVGSNEDLTDAQFIQRSNDLIARRVASRYDGRVRIVPRTYFTEDDTARGFSWNCDVDMYMGTPLSVGQFTVRANRFSALNGEATA